MTHEVPTTAKGADSMVGATLWARAVVPAPRPPRNEGASVAPRRLPSSKRHRGSGRMPSALAQDPSCWVVGRRRGRLNPSRGVLLENVATERYRNGQVAIGRQGSRPKRAHAHTHGACTHTSVRTHKPYCCVWEASNAEDNWWGTRGGQPPQTGRREGSIALTPGMPSYNRRSPGWPRGRAKLS